MKAFHETAREEILEIEIQRNRCSTFVPHFHAHLEVLIIKRGNHAITINGQSHSVGENSIVLFDSYDVHGYDDSDLKNRDDCVIIIPPKFTRQFDTLRQNKRAKNPIITSKSLCDTLLQIVDTIILKNDSPAVKCASVELILTLLNEHFDFSISDYGAENGLIRKVLDYISKNYRENISLPIISKSLGYTEAHISRVFHKYMKVGIPQYINDLRLEYVESETKKNEQSTTEVIFNSGFNSIQSYYRNKARKNKTQS